jgi:hypothetical protein
MVRDNPEFSQAGDDSPAGSVVVWCGGVQCWNDPSSLMQKVRQRISMCLSHWLIDGLLDEGTWVLYICGCRTEILIIFDWFATCFRTRATLWTYRWTALNGGPLKRSLLQKTVNRNSSIGTATRYGLDGSRIESRWRRDFPLPSRPDMGPTQPPIECVPGLFPGGKVTGAWR